MLNAEITNSGSFRDLIKNYFTYKENGEERKITDDEIDELERMLEIMKKMDSKDN